MQLHRDREEFEAAGAKVVLIGQATPRHAAHFRRRYAPELPVLADGERRSYEAAGAKRATVGELLGPRMLLKGAQTTLRDRVHQGRTIGDPAQLGGVLIVAPDGTIPYAHLSDDASDNPPNDEVLEAARKAAAA